MNISTMEPGTKISLPLRKIEREEMIEFAREFDQAPFHLDEEAAKATMLGGLCTSGWQTCSLALQMMYEAFFKDTNYQGAESMEECRWLKPVFVNDILSGTATLIEVRSLEIGIAATFDYVLKNQNGEPVLTMKHTSIFAGMEGQND